MSEKKPSKTEINRCLKNAETYRKIGLDYLARGDQGLADDYAKKARYWETRAQDLENPPVQKFQLLCVWCGEPWTEKMMNVEARTSQGCDTCGHGSGAYGTVTVTCESCCRVVFAKEFDETN